MLQPTPTFDSLPDLCTPEEAGAFLRTSRNTTYELIRTGKLPSIRFGRLIRIKKTVLLGGESA
jgi:excisionase family DNA binding protein